MLTRLSVRNLAVVEKADAEFGPGLNIITGETGSGKSVLKGALGLALGARAAPSAVREGAAEARIEAEFQLSGDALAAVGGFLEQSGLPPCEDGSLLIRRTVQASGGGRIRVNDAAATGKTLRKLGSLLADLHGPDDSRALADGSVQRSMLDAYARTDRSEYSAAWAGLASASAALESLRRESGAGRDAEIERLRDTIAEIDEAALSPEDDGDALTARHAAAAHAAEIVEDASAACAALDGDDGQSAAAALISAGASIASMARFMPDAAEWRASAEAAVVQVQELSRAISGAASRIDADPETLASIDARLSLVRRLMRKYSAAGVQDVIDARNAAAARLEILENIGGRIAAQEKAVADARRAVDAAGAALSAARRKGAAKLAAAVTAELRGLGFLKAFFDVSVEKTEPSPSGCDAVEFMFGPNPGEPSRPLGEIASSGEMARVLLAVETVLAGVDSTPLLFFDEIDSNISGETGRAVGERLRRVAAVRQVIAITHLPQSAVYGARHLAVSKSVSGGRTRSSVTLLEGEARAAEIARMLGGGAPASAAAHARELLAAAKRG